MRDEDLLAALGRLKVETGSLACMGCGYEHSYGALAAEMVRESMTMTANWLGITAASKVALEMTEE